MKKIHYRITVNINDKVMKLGFRGSLPKEHLDKKIRVQAIFTIRQVDRRFPMEVEIEDTDIGPQIRADAIIELPYVFLTPPRRRVTVTFALWYGMEEIILDDQPFPVQKEMFARTDGPARRSAVRFAALSAALPILLLKSFVSCGRDMDRAKREVNEYVYLKSGMSYSPRQRHTSFFASEYMKEVRRTKGVENNRILFLSERSPGERDNLQRIRRLFEDDPDIEVREFINTRTVDRLTRNELRECARECARARVIILEDFYPQLHSLSIRPETAVVQLWHACGAFKTFGFSHMNKPGGAPQSSMNHRCYDLVSVSSEKIRGIYAEAFALPLKKVQAIGVPRTDDLFDEEYKEAKREELQKKYPVLVNNRVILFAPTFRGEGNKDAFFPEEAFDIHQFMKEMPEDTVLIIRHHPFVKNASAIPPAYADRVIDLSGEEHINDLMLLTDLLITDYSSSIFEAAVLRLPMLFYAFDLEEYIRDRDFYFDYMRTVPGPVETAFDGLVARAREMMDEETETERGKDEETETERGKDEEAETERGKDEEAETEREKDKEAYFRESFLGALDGDSTDRVYQYIRHNFLKGV